MNEVKHTPEDTLLPIVKARAFDRPCGPSPRSRLSKREHSIGRVDPALAPDCQSESIRSAVWTQPSLPIVKARAFDRPCGPSPRSRLSKREHSIGRVDPALAPDRQSESIRSAVWTQPSLPIAKARAFDRPCGPSPRSRSPKREHSIGRVDPALAPDRQSGAVQSALWTQPSLPITKAGQFNRPCGPSPRSRSPKRGSSIGPVDPALAPDHQSGAVQSALWTQPSASLAAPATGLLDQPGPAGHYDLINDEGPELTAGSSPEHSRTGQHATLPVSPQSGRAFTRW